MNVKVEEIYLVMVSFNQVFIGRTAEELYNALYYRHYPFCEVAVLNTLEEAQYYAWQRYHANFLSNPYLYGFAPMPLPMMSNKSGYNIRGNDFVEIPVDVVPTNNNELANISNQQMTFCSDSMSYDKPVLKENVNDRLYWAIDAMNGYAVASNLDELIHFLLNVGLIYSHAVPYGNECLAAVNSRSAYLNRFSCRYGFSEEIELLQNLISSGEYFIDSRYEEREKKNEDNRVRSYLLSCGLL